MNRREFLLYIPLGLFGIVFIPMQLIEAIMEKVGSFDSTIYWIGVIGMFACSIPVILLFLISQTERYSWISDRMENWLTYGKGKEEVNHE